MSPVRARNFWAGRDIQKRRRSPLSSAARPEIAEVRLTLPNRHHFAVDLAPFGLPNRDQVFHVADRPYGLIEGTVLREGAPAGPALDW